ncbi:hypothetical protein NAT51_01835 [Flavobacterium amniphilum]|uniref:hypothetical protein n=1 Tax=Flavobacterium amniphilum TaxID=1834035 RepID=UPI00202A5E2E|nr:hypothetical protein [Flavobacterium amniphilum]MCL9804248.1 hypothetical protein [Flavobacterium amniphilum]
MSKMYHYATVSKALEELKAKGFTFDFNLHEKDIVAHPENYEIVHIYRYEGESDPGDEATVYGIKSLKNKQMGVFVSGFAANSENDAARILSDLSIKDKK